MPAPPSPQHTGLRVWLDRARRRQDREVPLPEIAQGSSESFGEGRAPRREFPAKTLGRVERVPVGRACQASSSNCPVFGQVRENRRPVCTRAFCHSSLIFAAPMGILHIYKNAGSIIAEGPRLGRPQKPTPECIWTAGAREPPATQRDRRGIDVGVIGHPD
jgi:hypothetical protein